MRKGKGPLMEVFATGLGQPPGAPGSADAPPAGTRLSGSPARPSPTPPLWGASRAPGHGTGVASAPLPPAQETGRERGLAAVPCSGPAGQWPGAAAEGAAAGDRGRAKERLPGSRRLT